MLSMACASWRSQLLVDLGDGHAEPEGLQAGGCDPEADHTEEEQGERRLTRFADDHR